MRALESIGWWRTESREREPYLQKIALFAQRPMNGMGKVEPTVPYHMVRQLDDGRWSSKGPYLEPLAFDWIELCCLPLCQPAAILARHKQPGRRCE